MHLWKLDSDPSFLIAFSEGRTAPPNVPFPTASLARSFIDSLGVGDCSLAWARQVHGIDVLDIDDDMAPGETRCAGEGDVLVSRRSGRALVVQTADCVPILLWAPGAISAVHAGWRGTVKNAAGTAVRALATRFGVAPHDIRAVIGPAIASCCYEVGGEVAANFAGDFLRRPCGGKFRLDLKAANRAQLQAEGVRPENIEVLPYCTKCGGERFASYRRDGTNAGRMIALIAML